MPCMGIYGGKTDMQPSCARFSCRVNAHDHHICLCSIFYFVHIFAMNVPMWNYDGTSNPVEETPEVETAENAENSQTTQDPVQTEPTGIPPVSSEDVVPVPQTEETDNVQQDVNSELSSQSDSAVSESENTDTENATESQSE